MAAGADARQAVAHGAAFDMATGFGEGMMDNKPKTIRLDYRDIASLAVQILENAEDGHKLFSMTNNYPRGVKAVEYGFLFTCGCVFAICSAIGMGGLLSWLF
jgi:hypothetical protein